ncbi:MAG: acid phosphatase, partial [Rhodocyclaceae bacterium]
MKTKSLPFGRQSWPLTLIAALVLSACGSDHHSNQTASLQANVKNVVVIYAENRSFDNLYGNFPGANGLSSLYDASGKLNANYIPQKDRNGNVLSTLPQTWGGVTAGGVTPVVTQAQSAGLANAPFSIETAFQASANATLTTGTVTRDLYHRFFENQMQINGGKNDMFAAWADAGGL